MEVDPFVATVPERSASAVAVEELSDEEDSSEEAASEEAASEEDSSEFDASELAELLELPHAANIIAADVTAAKTAITCFFFIFLHPPLKQLCNTLDSNYLTESL